MYKRQELDLIKNRLDPDLYPDVNWIDEIMKRNSIQQNYYVSAKGGGDVARYFLSLGYQDEGCLLYTSTKLPLDRAMVTTPIGLPGMKGYKDGGPDIALFNHPFGVAVSADGQIVYVADTGNKVIRKLSIQ